MTRWSIYVGTFTPEWVDIMERLRSSATKWFPERAGTATTVRAPIRPRTHPWEEGGSVSDGIERFSFDDAAGTLGYVETVSGDIANPQYLVRHPSLPILYAAEYTFAGRLLEFAIGGDGTLKRRSATASLGALAVAVSVHPSGKFAYVAHWGNGALTAFPLDDTGRVLAAESIVRPPHGVPERPHHHQVRPTPSGNGLVVTDFGGDQILAYRSDPDGTVSLPPVAAVEFPKGSGPRHVEFHPSGRFVFVGCEWDSNLYVLEAEDGIPIRVLNRYSIVPPDYRASYKAMTSELHFHPDGQTLYVAHRDSGAIAIFSVDDSGALETLGHQSALGAGPSSIRIDPPGQHLFVGNVFSGSLVVFRIDANRLLQPIGAPVQARAPRSLVIIEDAS